MTQEKTFYSNNPDWVFGKDYFGFVYIWYNRGALEMERRDVIKDHAKRLQKKHPRLYIGSHFGAFDDKYICSSSWMKNSYNKCPTNFMRRILYWQLTPNYNELLYTEQKYLDLIHDEELGIRFYNLKKTAKGPDWNNPSYRAHMLSKLNERWADLDFKKRMSEIQKARANTSKFKTWASENAKKLHANGHSKYMSNVMTKKWADEKYRDRLSEIQKIAQNRPEQLQKISEASKALWQDSDYAIRARSGLDRIRHNPKSDYHKKAVAAGMKARWQDETYKKIMKTSAKRRAATKEGKEQLANNAKKMWNNPESRQKFSETRQKKLETIKADPIAYAAYKERQKTAAMARWKKTI